jgi:hypothetical protein
MVTSADFRQVALSECPLCPESDLMLRDGEMSRSAKWGVFGYTRAMCIGFLVFRLKFPPFYTRLLARVT